MRPVNEAITEALGHTNRHTMLSTLWDRDSTRTQVPGRISTWLHMLRHKDIPRR